MSDVKTKRRYVKHKFNKKSKRTQKKYYGGKKTMRRKYIKKHKGGFKADEVDILEDRDDDWMVTKQ